MEVTQRIASGEIKELLDTIDKLHEQIDKLRTDLERAERAFLRIEKYYYPEGFDDSLDAIKGIIDDYFKEKEAGK